MRDHQQIPASDQGLAGILADLATEHSATDLVLDCSEGGDCGQTVYRQRGAVVRDDVRKPDLARALTAAFGSAHDGRSVETPGHAVIRAMRIEFDPSSRSLVARVLPRTILDGLGA